MIQFYIFIFFPKTVSLKNYPVITVHKCIKHCLDRYLRFQCKKKMDGVKICCKFICDGHITNRKTLFREALVQAKDGKVLYILKEELKELPQMSQDLKLINKHYLKMISFLYVSNFEVLIESLSTLPNWQHVPSTIILEDINEYCTMHEEHNACGLAALLKDTIQSCAKKLETNCNLYVSINKDVVGEEYCSLLQELYGVNM